MTKQETIARLGKRPDNIIGSKEYPIGIIDVIQYSVWSIDGRVTERYWLYFLNDTLKQWGRPGDWQKAADQVYELRIK